MATLRPDHPMLHAARLAAKTIGLLATFLVGRLAVEALFWEFFGDEFLYWPGRKLALSLGWLGGIAATVFLLGRARVQELLATVAPGPTVTESPASPTGGPRWLALAPVAVYLGLALAVLQAALEKLCLQIAPPGSYYPPLMTEHRLHPGRPTTIDGPGGPLDAIPFRLEHGDMDALGFRFAGAQGDVAYTPDLNAVPPDSARFLEGLDLWIIDALRYQRHGTHLSVEQALALVEHYKPKRAVLTDLHVDLDYDVLSAMLPENVAVAYDGMQLKA